MPRVRMINPNGPKDEAVASCSVMARLAWAYLPCHADREGRLPDKPFLLRCEIFPADQGVDMPAILAELAAAGLITRYEVAGKRFICIPNFRKHQNPHRNEARSKIPPPPGGAPDGAPPAPWVEPTSHAAEESDDIEELPEDAGDDESPPGDVAKLPEPSRHAPRAPAVTGSPEYGSPGPVTGNPETQTPERARAGDPRPRAPEPEPSPALHRYDRTPGGLVWTADKIMATFGKAREQVFPKSIDFHVAGRGIRENAHQLSLNLDKHPEYAQHLEATMLLHLRRAKVSPNPKDREVAWCFGQWVSRLTDLLEEVMGLRNAPDAPADQPCDFHGGDRNQGKAAPRHLFRRTCGECRHLHARASPRPPASGPESVGQLVGSFTARGET